MNRADSHALVADVGGTNVRFALRTAAGGLRYITRFRTVEHRSLESAVRAYLTRFKPEQHPTRAAFAVAAPILGDAVRLTNSPWRFSIAQFRRRFGWTSLDVINDFTAIALALPLLRGGDRRKIGGGRAVRRAAIGLLGPGTGLGVSGLIPCHGGYAPLESEGGKVTLAPFDQFESDILRLLRQEFHHVSAERLLSGDGLSLLHQTIATLRGERARKLSPETVTRRARTRAAPTCRQTIDTFCSLLGTVASDLALTLGATGGIYIAGGIVPKFGTLFQQSPFRKRFESKGRFSRYLAAIPTYLVTHPNPALVGLGSLVDRRD